MGISTELLRKIAEFHNAGYSNSEIAKVLNIPEVVVNKIVTVPYKKEL